MSIKKPLGLGLVIGLLAMAFAALPAMASAHSLTSPAGTLVPAKATINATSTNATTVFPEIASTLTCESAVIHGIVAKNTGGVVEVTMDEAKDTATGCKLNGAKTEVGVTFTSISLSTAGTTATFDFTAPGVSEECTVTITYTPPATKIHAAGPCVGTFNGNFTADFTATVASTGKAVIFD